MGSAVAQTQPQELPASKVDFPAFMALAEQVQDYRQERLLPLDRFLAAAQEPDTVILDARSWEMYDEMHLQGAVHLDFSDFTSASLECLIPNRDTRILIYCNNNFDDAPRVFATKASPLSLRDLQSTKPAPSRKGAPAQLASNALLDTMIASGVRRGDEQLTLALNIPTFINLYGYGYRNVYELADFVSINDPRLRFEGEVAKGRRRP
jgi:hypothetical protein